MWFKVFMCDHGMSRIVLYASEIAALAGRHPYKPRREALLAVIKRFAPDTYAERNFESTEDIANKILERSTELKKHINTIKETTKNITDVVTAVTSSTEMLKACLPNANPEESKVVADKIRSTAFTSLGTNCESKVYAKLPKLLGIEVTKTDALLKRQIGILPKTKTPLLICGRLDALGIDGTVVEIKNRVRRLFGHVPEYERIQVLTYLFLSGSKEGFLVEAFNDQCASYKVLLDDEEWESIKNSVISGIEDFLDAEKIST